MTHPIPPSSDEDRAFVQQIYDQFLAARQLHAAVPFMGNYRPANEALGKVLQPIDQIIKASGAWPKEKTFLSNDDRQSILEKILAA